MNIKPTENNIISPIKTIENYSKAEDKQQIYNKTTVCQAIKRLTEEGVVFDKNQYDTLSKSISGLKKYTIKSKLDKWIDSFKIKLARFLGRKESQFSKDDYTKLIQSLEMKLAQQKPHMLHIAFKPKLCLKPSS